MHGGMLERDRSVGWRTGSTRVPLTEETTNEGQGSLRRQSIQNVTGVEHFAAPRRCWPPCDAPTDTASESHAITRC